MKNIYSFTLMSFIGISAAFSQCAEVPTNRVLLVGDSWASFMNADQTITDGLRNMGHSDKRFASSVVIAENGAQTDDFLTQTKQDAIQQLIDANPDIDIVHLSIGGNDVMGDWNVSWSQEMTDSLEGEVAGRLEEVIEFLKSTRPGMRVFWAGYTHPNFGEVIEDIAPAQTVHPFYSTWNDMGQPTFIQINTILNEFSDSVAAYADDDPLVDFVPAQGILQYAYGQEIPLGIAPGGTYAQFSAPLPLGYPDYPSPMETMRLYAGIFTDCFHLSADAYLTMWMYQAQKFYQKYFMDDFYLLSEGGSKDGSVTSTGTVSSTLQIGETGGNAVATVLSFNTTQMADTTLAAANIFLRRESLTGTNPLQGTDVQVKVVSGSFGATANVEAEDFMDNGDQMDIPCKHGSFAQDGHWVRLDLTPEILAVINNGSRTQFELSIPGFTGGLMTFNDASDPELAPVLNMVYGPTPNPESVNELVYGKELPVYPVPTDGPLTIASGTATVLSVEVMNVLGSVVLQPAVNDKNIDISNLPNGPYVLRITTNEGTSTKQIIKH